MTAPSKQAEPGAQKTTRVANPPMLHPDQPSGEVYPWPSWKVTNPKGRVGSAIGVCVFGALLACAFVWWPFYSVVMLSLVEALAVLRLYQEWVEKGAWAK